jgi:hypothetical protein
MLGVGDLSALATGGVRYVLAAKLSFSSNGEPVGDQSLPTVPRVLPIALIRAVAVRSGAEGVNLAALCQGLAYYLA